MNIFNRFQKLFCKDNVELEKLDFQENWEAEEGSIAEKLHDAEHLRYKINDIIDEAFMRYEPEIHRGLDFTFGSDYYDNSIEIYFHKSLPYPYEPCNEIRETIYAMGFSSVYWNFLEDVADVKCNRIYPPPPDGIYKNSPDEIRDYEPRHSKNAIWKETKYGYVDDRFNEEEWKSKYNFKNQ